MSIGKLRYLGNFIAWRVLVGNGGKFTILDFGFVTPGSSSTTTNI